MTTFALRNSRKEKRESIAPQRPDQREERS